MTDNPFSSPKSLAGPLKSTALPFSRPAIAIGLTVIGLIIAIFFLIFGYILIIALLNSTLCPHLERQGNFGQFGFMIILLAPMFLISGMSFGLIPFLRWWVWSFCFLAIFAVLHFLAGMLEELQNNTLHVSNIALLVIGFLFWFIGSLTRCIYWFIERRMIRN